MFLEKRIADSTNTQKGVPMKRTFVVPDEKEDVYVKFKELVQEVSSKLVEMMEDYINKYEAIQASLEEQTTFSGKEKDNIFVGKTFKFYGVKIAGDVNEYGFGKKVYFTKKSKFVVTSCRNTHPVSYDTIPYDDYFEMIKKAELSKKIIKECAEYLDKNSILRPYEFLDV
jgi:hypothetical protein